MKKVSKFLKKNYVPHRMDGWSRTMDFTYVCIIIGSIIKKKKLNLSRVEGPRTEQKLPGTERKLT